MTKNRIKRNGVDWRAPIALGVLTASGLLSALVSDGIGDVWAWIGLAAPLVAAGYCIWRRPKPKSSLCGKRVSKRQSA
jgi:hypothetical protein